MSSKKKQKQKQKQAAAAQTAKAGNAASVQVNTATPTQVQKTTQTKPDKSGARTNKAPVELSFPQRLIGVITLKANVYREIAHDQKATMQAAGVVIVVALLVAIVSAIGVSNAATAGVSSVGVPTVRSPLGAAILVVIEELLIWGGVSVLIAAVARGYFHGNTNTGEMLRVFGFTRIFQILLVVGVFSSVIAAVVSIAGLVLGIIGTIIGIREATGFSTGKAAVAGIFAIVLVYVLVAFVATFVFNPIVTTLLPT